MNTYNKTRLKGYSKDQLKEASNAGTEKNLKCLKYRVY